jgi:separase
LSVPARFSTPIACIGVFCEGMGSCAYLAAPVVHAVVRIGEVTEDVSGLKVDEIKSRLRGLGLPVIGLKKDLVDRLRSALMKVQPLAHQGAAQAAESADRTEPAATKRSPVVLILDEALQRLPWESMRFLREHTVSRAPALSYVLAHGTQRPLSNSRLVLNGVRMTSVFFVLDPDHNLPRTRETLAPHFSSWRDDLGWQGVVGCAPEADAFRSALVEKDLVVYCGHGGGERLIRRDIIEKLPQCHSAVLLMGCSSGHLENCGEFEPTGVCASFLLAGCPAAIGNLWDVTDKDIDRFTESLLRAWATSCPRTGLGEAIAPSREVCKLRMLTGCAPVYYGLPLNLSSHGGCS